MPFDIWFVTGLDSETPLEGVKCTLDGDVKYTGSDGTCIFPNIEAGSHYYSVEKDGFYVFNGYDVLNNPLESRGVMTIDPDWIPGAPWILGFVFKPLPLHLVLIPLAVGSSLVYFGLRGK